MFSGGKHRRNRPAAAAAAFAVAIAINAAMPRSALADNIEGVAVPSPLLAIDQNRQSIVDGIVEQWRPGFRHAFGAAAAEREADLREALMKLRADRLLSASLAGTEEGLARILSLPADDSVRRAPLKSLGDAGQDLTYVPVTPCRLVETRGSFAAVYQGGGAFGGGTIRNYTIASGNGVCVSQLPDGLDPAAVQLQVFGIPTSSFSSGDIEILPQGSAFGSTATLVYLGSVAFTSVSTTARVNLANNQIGVQVRGGGANVAIDVVGYFKAPPDVDLTYATATGNAIRVLSTNASNTSPAIEAHEAGNASAVYGVNVATTGSTTGVLGESSSTSHGIGATGGATGVLGRVTPTTPGGYSAGVRGINNGTGGTGIGVVGYQGGSGWGVYGETPSGFGVYGLTTNNSSASVGVRGETFSTNGIAVEAKYSGTGVGVALEVDNGAIRVAGVNKAAFIHTATVANKLSANGTDVDHPMANGDPNALLFVTQRLNPSGIVYNNSPIGVYYNTVRSRWEIFNENNAVIPTNAQFHVLVIKQ
jgi:hypothetical protein